MAYTKTVWQTGDVITAAKLNNAEDGIEAAQGVVITGAWSEVSGEQWFTFDHTYTEIKAIMDNGIQPVFIVKENAGISFPLMYFTSLQCDFTTKRIQLDVQGELVTSDELSDDVPVIVLS